MKPSLNRYIQKGLEKLALLFASASALSLISIAVIVVVSVLMRKLANSPLHITEELVGLLVSVSLFLGLPMVSLKANHVRVSILADKLQGKAHSVLNKIALIIGLIFFSWIILDAIPWLEFAHRLNLKTETTRLLLYPWMSLLPLSIILSWCIFLARLLGIIEENNTPTEQVEVH